MIRQVGFRDIPADSFPFTVEWISEATNEVVYTVTVPGPGVVEVPALWPQHGPCWTRIRYPDGQIVEWRLA